jgi:hypothetical protein
MKKAAFIAWKSELLDIVYPIVVAMNVAVMWSNQYGVKVVSD